MVIFWLQAVNSQPTNKAINNPQWQQVAIGGGGYVTGIYLHPQEANLVYMQTDNGGFYRWQPNTQQWQPLIDRFPTHPWNHYGGEALALDPNNPDLIYLALGKYRSSNGKLWKSSDRGTTWMESDLRVPMGGDEEKRWAGNRLAVSPFDSNLLLFGSRSSGLWRSLDGGIHWTQVKFNLSTRPDIGITGVAFDPQVAERVYLSAYGDGIYQSNDRGKTWGKMDDSPQQGMKIAVASDSSLYVTSDIAPGVSKYHNGVWQDITPQKYRNHIFNALSIHPWRGNEILVGLGETSHPAIFYSADAGDTWIEKPAQHNFTVPWWPDFFFANHLAAIAFDPHVDQRIWLTDWFGVWRTDDFGSNPPTWTNYAEGHEQLVPFNLVAPPQGGQLLSGVADVEGFYHHDLDSFPQSRLGYISGEGKDVALRFPQRLVVRNFQDTYDLAYCATQPLNLVRVGGHRDAGISQGAISGDGGLTWKEFPTLPSSAIPLRVAVSATNPQVFVVVFSESQPWQTRDGGHSWQPVSGLPDGITGPWNWSQPLAADPIDGNIFYYYAEGKVYRSDDGGGTFKVVDRSLPRSDWHSIQTILGLEAEIWLNLGIKGLFYSGDRGASFVRLTSVNRAELITAGKAPAGKLLPIIYLYGSVANLGEGLFASGDRGKTWSKLDNLPLFSESQNRIILVLEASKQQPGLVFLGTDAKGIYYRYFNLNF
ncbi:MAG: hypothetical protein ACFCU5_13205 [Pleurocapsa sp.]